MRTVQDIDREIRELEEKLEHVEGRPTEVYSRIVGYYRSLRNWNRGKREEYNHRIVFTPDLGTDATEVGTVVAGQETASMANTPINIDALLLRAGETAYGIESSAIETAGIGSEESKAVTYMYFYRKTCPNCPPVRSMLVHFELPGIETDVDTEEGNLAALENGIYTTPTVVFFNSQHDEITRASTVGELLRLKIPQMA